MEQAKVHIDAFKPAHEQVKAVLEKIQPILPIAFEKVEIAIKIPMEHAGRATSVVRSIAQIKREEWKPDCWIAVIDIPAGMQADIYKKLNDITAGKVEVKILKADKV
jgi:ribosome maturation protein SDO1